MGAVVHKSHSSSFPDTWEYDFPLSEVGGRGVPAAVVSCVGRDQTAAAAAVARRLEELKTPEVREFARLFDGMIPTSVMVQGEKCWLVVKRAEDQLSPTQFGNVIMVPALTQSLEWPPEVAGDFAQASYMLEFFEQFGGLALFVPPQACCAACNDELYVMRDKTFPGLGEWDGSLAFYYPGDGDVMLARPDGSAGVWQHEFSAGYDESTYDDGPLGLLVKAIHSLLPSPPSPASLPPDCVDRCDKKILVEVRESIKWAMAHLT